jgi:DNA-binding SARP family transcriptional activator
MEEAHMKDKDTDVWVIQIIDGLSARRGNVALSISGKNPTHLLAWLALDFDRRTNRRLPKDSVYTAFWPQALDNNKVRNSLSQMVRKLQTAFWKPETIKVIESDHTGLKLSAAHVVVDLNEFDIAVERARKARVSGSFNTEANYLHQAISWCGNAHSPTVLPGFDDAIYFRRNTNLTEKYVETLYRYSELYAIAGDLSKAQRWANRAVIAEPHDERAHVLLMHIFARNGEVGLAINQYNRLKAGLSSTYHSAPSPETEMLAQNMMKSTYRAWPYPNENVTIHPGPFGETSRPLFA